MENDIEWICFVVLFLRYVLHYLFTAPKIVIVAIGGKNSEEAGDSFGLQLQAKLEALRDEAEAGKINYVHLYK